MGSKEFTKKLIPGGDDRLRININTEKGNVTDVVVQYESKIKDKWYPIVDMIAHMVFSIAIF